MCPRLPLLTGAGRFCEVAVEASAEASAGGASLRARPSAWVVRPVPPRGGCLSVCTGPGACLTVRVCQRVVSAVEGIVGVGMRGCVGRETRIWGYILRCLWRMFGGVSGVCVTRVSKG